MHTDFEKYRYSAYKCRHSYKGVDTLDNNIDPFCLQNHRYLLEFESIDIWHKGADTLTQKCRHIHLNIDLFGRHNAIVRRKTVDFEACINTHRGQMGLKTSHLFLSVSLSKNPIVSHSLTSICSRLDPQHSSFRLSLISHLFHCHWVLHWTWNSKVKEKDKNLGF